MVEIVLHKKLKRLKMLQSWETKVEPFNSLESTAYQYYCIFSLYDFQIFVLQTFSNSDIDSLFIQVIK